jgi:manganese/iron transport system permease protein
VFPGAVLAAALGGSIIAGSAAAGLAAAAGITLAARSSRTSDETAIGVVFTGMFALGVLLASALGPLDRDIASFLFGNVLGVDRGDLLASAVITALVLGVLFAIRRPLLAGSFDRDTGAAGRRVSTVDIVLLCAIALAVVVSIRAIGNVLVLALFVTPAATARLVARRVPTMIAASVVVGVAAGIGGLYLSYHAGVAAGGSVVLVATGLFVLTWIASPRAGLVAALRRTRVGSPTAT